MTDLPKEIWAYMDCGNGALWHEPTHPADQDAIKYIRHDIHTAEIAKRDRTIEVLIAGMQYTINGH